MCFRTRYWLPLAVMLPLLGCEKEQHERTSEPAASVDKTAAIDPALAKAVAAASSRSAQGAAPGGSGEPPAAGIFPPGAADAEIKKGTPPKLTLGSAGSEPRVTLGPGQPKPGFKTAGTINMQVQSDPQQGPLPVVLALSIEALKSKSADAGAGEPVTLSAKITSAKLGITGVPADLEARFGKLKGSKVEYEVAADGAGSGYRTELAPGAETVRDQLRQLSDAIALVTLPLPKEPVGAGAYWMATSREGVFGLDLVTYRLIKVEALTGDMVTLSVGTKRYATSTRFDFEGLPPDAPHELAEFACKSDGKLVLKAGSSFPLTGDLQSLLAAALVIPGQQEQRGNLQVQTRFSLDFKPR